MATVWTFEHSVFTKAPRRIAWAFWSDLSNHARMDPGIEAIELDGPFETGTKGRTITADHEQEWELRDVLDEQQFVISGATTGVTLSFAWRFEDEGSGTRLTQEIRLDGPFAKHYLEEARLMEVHAGKAMAALARELDELV